MAKLGVIHYNWPGLSFDDFLRAAAEIGYKYVELSITDVWHDENEPPERTAEAVRKQVEGHGLQISALAARNDFLQPDEHAVQVEVERMKRICAIARILGEDTVVRSEGGVPKDEIPEEGWLAGLYECFSRCVEFANEKQVGIAIDNHGIITNHGDILIELIKKIDCKYIGSNLDTMNFRWLGNSLEDCDRFYEALAPHVLHTHLKDGFDSREHYRGAALGDGEIHLQHALDCLKKAGYNGVFCAEYEGPEAKDGVGYKKCYEWMNKNVA